MNMLLPGMYVADESILHRLDPRLKMVGALGLMALPFVVQGLPAYVLLAGLVLGLALLARAPLPALLRTVMTVFWLAVLMFIFYLFTTPGRALFSMWGIRLTIEGLQAGSVQVYRICLLVTISALLTYTTSPSQLAQGTEALLGPLARIGVPVRDISLVLTIALRFVPTVVDEIETISRAQRARGVELNAGGLARRLRSLVPIFVPVFVAAVRRAEELAVAMDARGFRSSPHPTHMTRLRLGQADLVAALIALAAGLAILGIDRWL
jgi:energy-coupling factor transport system permease protein